MRCDFDYLQTVIVSAQLQVDDIGDCCILARNDIGEEFYILTRTIMGQTEIIEYGPSVPDIGLLPNFVNLSYSRIDYNESKIEKAIDNFLNNPKRVITQAQIIEASDLIDLILGSAHKFFDNFYTYEKPLCEEEVDDE